jgi:dihydropteroate synthase
VAISIDTTLTEVAAAAVDAGANIVNDVSAGRDDPAMFTFVAQQRAPIVLMHMQGSPKTMQADPRYDDVVAEVRSFLTERAKIAIAAGVDAGQIAIDPGIGFGKTREHNLSLLAGIGELVATGFPVLLGASRKRFMGSLCYEREPANLESATCATTALGVLAGARCFRVHDVKANRQAADVAMAIRDAGMKMASVE